MVTDAGVPDVPAEGEAEQPDIDQVNGGAPDSARVTLIVTVTEAA